MLKPFSSCVILSSVYKIQDQQQTFICKGNNIRIKLKRLAYFRLAATYFQCQSLFFVNWHYSRSHCESRVVWTAWVFTGRNSRMPDCAASFQTRNDTGFYSHSLNSAAARLLEEVVQCEPSFKRKYCGRIIIPYIFSLCYGPIKNGWQAALGPWAVALTPLVRGTSFFWCYKLLALLSCQPEHLWLFSTLVPE